ncbi:hypothetical protein [Ligilactobacillus salivarius]|uniref:Uncharacterized protein n=2 Tax=Bacilli TaxID=91061 RepID=A0A6N9ITR1_9LACO|nr:hypothetical protein [Ligilactobacillus salivarius]MDF4187283.1 hypothetical protein [Ligilactobacillus salivarius]MYY65811.1 hypothetical protein [Ligilactobacillus salivarius]
MKVQTGYNKSTFELCFPAASAFHALLGGGLQDIHEYKENQRTENIVAKALDFYVEGMGVQRVKFPADYQLLKIPDMAIVKLINPTAVVYRGNVYVKADGIELAKN